MLGLFALGPALPGVAAAFSGDPHSDLIAQLIGGAGGFSFALSSPIIGGMIGRWGYKQVYISSLVAFAIFGTLPVLLDSLPMILMTRIVLGFCTAGAMTAGLAGLATLPTDVRPGIYGRNAMIGSVGAIIIFPAVGAISTLGWRWPFLIHLLALVVAPMALALPKVAKQSFRNRARRPVIGARSVSPLILMLAAFIGLIMYVGPMFSPFYLRSIGVTDPRLAALPLSGMSFAGLFMTMSYSRLHARLGEPMLFAITLLLAGVGLLLAGFALTLPMFFVAMVTVSCGLSVFTPNLISYIAATSASPARDIGWAMSAMFAVQVAFPFLAHAISQAVGPKGVFAIFGIGAVIMGLVALFLMRATIRPATEMDDKRPEIPEVR
jgi:MFS family permease